MPQVYLRAIKNDTHEKFDAKIEKWRSYSDDSSQCSAPTRTRRAWNGVSRVSARSRNSEPTWIPNLSVYELMAGRSRTTWKQTQERQEMDAGVAVEYWMLELTILVLSIHRQV